LDTLSAGTRNHSCIFIEGEASGEVLVCDEGLSFWGGVDPDTGSIIDVHHPNYGASVSGKILMMPTSRGSCSGSGVLLELSLNSLAPAALVFQEHEEVLTLGALVSDRIFGRPLPTISLSPADYDLLARSKTASISGHRIKADNLDLDLELATTRLGDINLCEADNARLSGEAGPAARMAMEIICLMAAAGGTRHLTDVTRGHALLSLAPLICWTTHRCSGKSSGGQNLTLSFSRIRCSVRALPSILIISICLSQ
jgi:predicted aconitase with swiveling domain